MAATPLLAFAREFAGSAGSNDRTMLTVAKIKPPLVGHVRFGFCDSPAVARIDETDHIGLECAFESDLQVPHRYCCVANVVSVGIVSDAGIIIRHVVRVDVA